MNHQKFFEVAEKKFNAEEIKKINLAYWLSKKVHNGQKRDNGERYFEHCRRVARLLMENGDASVDEIIIALLHDCVEDGFVPDGLVEKLFGWYAAKSIEILSKVTPVFGSASGRIIEKKKKSLDEYFATISGADFHIRRVKLADRLDNISDMKEWLPDRRNKYVSETEKYVLPIAKETDSVFYAKLKKIVNEHNTKSITSLDKSYKNTKPAFILSCKECDQNAIVVTFDLTKRQVGVGRHCADVTEDELVKAFELASDGRFSELNIFLMRVERILPGYGDRVRSFEDGLHDFCSKCDAAYCDKHSSVWPVFEADGWYDYTEWKCLKGHTHMVDD